MCSEGAVHAAGRQAHVQRRHVVKMALLFHARLKTRFKDIKKVRELYRERCVRKGWQAVDVLKILEERKIGLIACAGVCAHEKIYERHIARVSNTESVCARSTPICRAYVPIQSSHANSNGKNHNYIIEPRSSAARAQRGAR